MLAAQAALGDRAAFDTLVQRHQARIHRVVRSLVRNDRSDAEDLTQETFIRAYRGIGRFRHTSTFRTWLHRIALNVVWSHRSRRRQRPLDVPAADHLREDLAPEIATSAHDPDMALIRRLAGARRTIVLEPDFESVAGFHGRGSKPERAWSHLAHAPLDELPEPLVRAVKLALASAHPRQPSYS